MKKTIIILCLVLAGCGFSPKKPDTKIDVIVKEGDKVEQEFSFELEPCYNPEDLPKADKGTLLEYYNIGNIAIDKLIECYVSNDYKINQINKNFEKKENGKYRIKK